jgi:1,2-diacylglycerol 3-beta-galactosyltransferase
MTTGNFREPIRLLFLIGDTGGGHRSAANAVRQALERSCPGRFDTVICDPLLGPGAPLRLRWLMRLYGPAIRLTPWFWGMLWRSYNSPRVLGWNRRTVLRPAYRSVAAAVAEHQPAVIVAFHALTAEPAVRARASSVPDASLVTVVTDLVTAHLSWRDAAVDRIIVPSAPVRHQCRLDGMAEDRYTEIGLPVGVEFSQPPVGTHARGALQRALGLRGGRFLVVVTGGAEGSGGIYRRTAAILGRQPGDVDVAVICGRNAMLRRRLTRLAARSGGRLTVQGFVDNMADWLRCADVVVGKAGPGTIAEAACCGAPLLLTSYVPGQEAGNADFVVSAGAGRYVPRLPDLITEIDRLKRDSRALAEMRQAAAAISRPGAAADIALMLASLADGGDRAARVAEPTLAAAWQPGNGIPPLAQRPEVWTVLPQRASRASRRARRDLIGFDGGGRRLKTLPRRRKLGKL